MQLILPVQPKILADSINWTTNRLTSFLIPIPTCLLAELRTHRLLKWSDSDFSVNANSDRAIPIEKKIKMVRECLYVPIPSLANKGMTAIEDVPEDLIEYAKQDTLEAFEEAAVRCLDLLSKGFSKQYVNRRLMPFSWSQGVITGDSKAWHHFFSQRTPKDVEPNFRYIVHLMKEAYDQSTPEFLSEGEWHISFKEEGLKHSDKIEDLLKVSGSCCARISYDIQREEDLAKHVSRFDACYSSNHVSITEHQAQTPTIHESKEKKYRSNTDGWILFRKRIENNELPNRKELIL